MLTFVRENDFFEMAKPTDPSCAKHKEEFGVTPHCDILRRLPQRVARFGCVRDHKAGQVECDKTHSRSQMSFI